MSTRRPILQSSARTRRHGCRVGRGDLSRSRGRRAAPVAALLIAALLLTACAAVDGPAKKPKRKQTRASAPIPSVTLNDPGKTRLVVLLGGSSARECVVSDASWARQIASLGAGTVKTFDLGSRNESFAQDIALVNALPKIPGVVFVGVTVGRFTGVGGGATSTDARAVLGGAEVRHQYTQADVLSAAAKRALVSHWVSDRYPLFKANYARNFAGLQKLVQAIKARGLRPVLLQLPLNLEAIGTKFDPAVGRYVKGCKALAAQSGIDWVDFVAELNLPSADFYDLFHLVEPGRVVWQKRLSHDAAGQLRQVPAKD